MRLRSLFLLMVVVSGCHASTERPQGESLVISEFSEPPQQQLEWIPNTNSVSPDLVSAVTTLFEQGLADPRGCDYREIEIHVGEIWTGEGKTVKTHGWVLPNSGKSSEVFAVCWNGLVYPVVAAGESASVQSDVESLLRTATTNESSMRMALYQRAFSENIAVAHDSLLPIKSCLLLRLGESNLAGRVWEACNTSVESTFPQQKVKGPYLMLAGAWAWSLFDRMICADMRGDVRLALVTARKLAAIQPKVETGAAQRGFPHPSYNDSLKHDKDRPYLYFLDQLPQVLADLERRKDNFKEKSVVEIGLTNFPNQSDRIAALIEDLDLVKARQMSQPGGVAPQTDPIVQALINEKNSAVEFLLICWENDKRLTCSVGFGRDFFRDRQVLPVAGAARAALQVILQTQFQSPAEARAFWRQYKGLAPEERWYQVLRDDSVAQEQPVRVMSAGGQSRTEMMPVFGRGHWMEAARMIVQPSNVIGVPGSGFYTSKPLAPGETTKLRGESLRSKQHPSVTELLVKNANLVAEKADGLDQFQGVDAIRAGTELAGIINTWEKAAAAGPARKLMQRAILLWPNPTTFIMSSGHDLARYIPRLAEYCVEAGDTNVLEDYAGWVKSADQAKVDEYAVEAFEPLCRNPTNPVVVAVSEWLFNDPASPWSTLPWKRSTFHNPIDSDLIKLPAFEKLLARELEKKNIVGSMEYFRPETINYTINDLGRATRGFPWPEGERPPLGTKVELRQCDWIAFSLSAAKRIPFFNPFAPVERRDELIRTVQATLTNSK